MQYNNANTTQQKKNSARTQHLLFQSEKMDQTVQSIGNQSVNEDCIKQAESLLQMFKQANQPSAQGQARNLGATATSHMTNMSIGNNSVARNPSKSTNLPLKGQRQRIGSAAADWSRNNSVINTSALHQDSAKHMSSRAIPHTQQKLMKDSAFNQSQNFRSLENMSSVSASVFSAQVPASNQLIPPKQQKAGNPPPVPPLQLKQRSDQRHRPGTNVHKSATLSQDGRERPHTLNTADDYFKYHKQKKMEERRNSSHVQLQKIEGVVSPISVKKHSAAPAQRQGSTQSAQMQLKPPSQTRLNTSTQHTRTAQFLTADAEANPSKQPKADRPTLPKSKRPPSSQMHTMNINDS